MFEQSIMKKICWAIGKYCEKHPEAPRKGGNFVWHDSNAFIDSIRLVCFIMDVFVADGIQDELKEC